MDHDANLPLSSVFRPSNRLGEGIFASADNWLKSISTPNFGGATVEAFCKIKNKPQDFLVDWAERHGDLLPHLGAWGREWQDGYPRFSDIAAEHKELHDQAVADASKKAAHADFCGRVLMGIQSSSQKFRKAEKLSLPLLLSYAEWWNSHHPATRIECRTKKLLLPRVAEVLNIELDE